MLRTSVSRSATRAIRGMCSQNCTPGTAVEIGWNDAANIERRVRLRVPRVDLALPAVGKDDHHRLRLTKAAASGRGRTSVPLRSHAVGDEAQPGQRAQAQPRPPRSAARYCSRLIDEFQHSADSSLRRAAIHPFLRQSSLPPLGDLRLHERQRVAASCSSLSNIRRQILVAAASSGRARPKASTIIQPL